MTEQEKQAIRERYREIPMKTTFEHWFTAKMDIRSLLEALNECDRQADSSFETASLMLETSIKLRNDNKRMRDALEKQDLKAKYWESRYEVAYVENQRLRKVLDDIETHIRSTSDPIPHIVQTLKVLEGME